MARSIDRLDSLCIVIYFLILFGMALYHSRKIRRQDDVFLAGRSMSRWPIAISMYMALFSTNTFLGYTGWVNRPNGTVWIGLQTIGIMLAVPLVVALFPELYFRLGLTSVYEYLDKRFSQPVRAVATVFFLLSRMMWLSAMLYSTSLVLSMMFGWTAANDFQSGQLWAIFAIGVLATIFALLGGMHTVIWADVMQFFVFMSALIAMLIIGTRLSGGIGQVIHTGREFGRFDPPQAFSLTDDLSIASGLLLGFIGMLASSGADQVLLQQYLTAKNEREAKASMWRNGFLLKPISLVYPFLGLIMYAYYHTHPDVAQLMRIPDDALPVFVLNVLPTGLRGLMISAIIAAVFTSLQSGLAAISAAAQVSYVKYRIGRPLSDRESVLLARTLLLVTGVCVMALACWVRALGQNNSIIQILNIVMYPFAGVLLGIFLLGILVPRANATGALVGGVAGFFGTVAFPLVSVLLPASLNSSGLQYLTHVSNFFYGLIGTFLTLAAGYGVSLLTAPPPEFRVKGLTRWSLPPAAEVELAATAELK